MIISDTDRYNSDLLDSRVILIRIKNIKSRWVWISFCFFILVSCQNENLLQKQIQGKWNVANAERNGKATSTLEDAFFLFEGDSLLTTNILRSIISVPYKLKDQKILQSGMPPIEYEIEEIFEDSLILSTQIRDYHFKFFLARDSSDLAD